MPSTLDLTAPQSAGIPDRDEILARLELIRHRRARRYVLRVSSTGRVRVTMPWWGTKTHAREFAGRHIAWIRGQLASAIRRAAIVPWGPGTRVPYRGEALALAHEAPGVGRLADLTFPVPDGGDWRPAVESAMRAQAVRELPPLVLECAARHGLIVRRVTVRAQRTRWGSCSRKGTISLNWRLVQTPEFVRDYLVAHELAHLREMNHSPRFWACVARFFPRWKEADDWLRRHGRELIPS